MLTHRRVEENRNGIQDGDIITTTHSTEENPSTVHYFTPTGIAVLVCLGFRIGMFKEAIISFVVVLSFLLLHCTGYGSTLNLCLSLASEVSVVIPTVVTIKYDTFTVV